MRTSKAEHGSPTGNLIRTWSPSLKVQIGIPANAAPLILLAKRGRFMCF
jgi:hypothetical protein